MQPQPPNHHHKKTPPDLTVLDEMGVEATSEQRAQITYTVFAQDDVDGNATLEEDVAVLSYKIFLEVALQFPATQLPVWFPIDDTEVECGATDEYRIWWWTEEKVRVLL